MKNYRKINRAEKSEYPSYSQYYFDLIATNDNILNDLHDNFFKIKDFIYSLPTEKLTYRYDTNKWTIKEILVHLIDDERIFAYRALRYARNDDTPLHGFEENAYARYSNANERSLDNIFEEYWSVRLSTLLLFENLPEASFLRAGSAIDIDGVIKNKRTVRALAYHIAGHELSHIKIIKERYLHQTVDALQVLL
ncbi:DinB family protein [Galbibacter sp. PAP.153]|uniref:DinB family protein n=1 Tax=Galbibacter sp. PAP.153 TaxID=3104623 RepID=UPI003009A413